MPFPSVSQRFFLTYNHQSFVRQALDSVLMQKVSFPYEIVIGDDCSTDGTREIVCEYQRNHPGKIRLLLAKRNLWKEISGGCGAVMVTAILRSCLGNYVAMLEGDDYWGDPRKLQTQLNLLEANPKLSGCFTAALFLNQASGQENLFRPHVLKESYDFEDFIQGPTAVTASVVYRRGLFDDLPSWLGTLPASDLALNLLNLQHGPYGFIPEPMCVYRVHGGGVWSGKSQSQRLKGDEAMLRTIELHFPHYAPAIRRALQWRLFWIANALENEGARPEAKARFRELRQVWLQNRVIPRPEMFKLGMRLHAPGLFRFLKRTLRKS